MRRALFASAVLATSALALPAMAQTSGYLNWAGRPDPAPAQAASSASGPAWRLANGRLNGPGRLPHGGYDQRADPPQYALTTAPGTRGDALTPAAEWTQGGPGAMGAPVRQPAYRSLSGPAQAYQRRGAEDAYYRDMRETMSAPPVQPTYGGDAPAQRPPVSANAMPGMNPGPVYADDRPMAPPSASAAYAPPTPTYGAFPRSTSPGSALAAPSSYPSASAVVAPTPAPPPANSGAPMTREMPVAAPVAEVDPMAPRRDAPIFRIQREAAEAAPVQQASRRYSVHRQNGQEPDPTPLPEGGYIDGLAITMPETLASQDLARPPDPPVLTRDNQGRVRAMPAPSEGDHQ